MPAPAARLPAARAALAVELAVALAVAVATVWVVGRFTPAIDATGWGFDEKVYLNVAVDGPLTAKPRTAPFLYRPGTTLLVGAVARAFHLPPERAFAAVAWVALPLFLFLIYVLARRYTSSRLRALVAMLLVGISFSATKRLVFNPISPDALGLALVALATLLLVSGRTTALLVVTAVGVACREFVVIPAVVLAIGAVRRPAPPPGRLARLAPLLAALVVGVLIRLVIPVAASHQIIDPAIPSSYRALAVALEPGWVTNVAGASLTFLLPLACVWRRRDDGGEGLPGWAPVYGLVLLVVMTFAGMNFMWFAAYYAPLLAVAYVLKARDEPVGLQLVLLVLMAGLGRVVEAVPHPLREPTEYVGFTAFFGHRIDVYTGRRALQLMAVFVCYRGLRAAWQELAVRRRPG